MNAEHWCEKLAFDLGAAFHYPEAEEYFRRHALIARMEMEIAAAFEAVKERSWKAK